MKEPSQVGVVGAGAWGTALAGVLARKGHAVTIWSFEEDVASSINRKKTNPYLPGVELPETLRATTDLESAVSDAQLIVSATPSQFVRGVMDRHLRASALTHQLLHGLYLCQT